MRRGGGQLTIPVKVADILETVPVTAKSSSTIRAVKREALQRAFQGKVSGEGYEVKHRGGLVLDESKTLGDLGVHSGVPLIVLASRRQPVR